jgi:DNA-binding transcriptional regulator LsrR (DeoR family)
VLGAGSASELVSTNPSIAQALGLARSADIYVVGLGSIEADLLYVRTGLVQAEDVQRLQTMAVVGDICGRFFDLDGRACPSPFEARVVGIELGDLRRAGLSIGVASGVDKVAPLLGALRGRYLNALVTDDGTARALLRLAETEQEGG